MDVTNWDEDAYRNTILEERGLEYRTVFRAIFGPSSTSNPNSDIVVSASSDGSIAAYSVSTILSSHELCNGISNSQKVPAVQPNCFLQAHQGPAYDVKFYGDDADALLLSCGDDGRIKGWKWKELEFSDTTIHVQGSHVKPIIDLINPQHRGPWNATSPISENNAIAVDHQGGSIFAAAGDTCAYNWDVETSKIKMVFKGHSDYLHCIIACKGSNQIITGSEDGTARIWDCRSGKCVQMISPERSKGLKELSSVSCITLDASESWLAYGSGQSIFVWNLLASQQISRICTPTTCQDVVFDHNNILAVGSSPILARMDINGKILSQIRCAPESAFSVSLNRSGVVAVAGYGGLVDVISEFGSHMCTFRSTTYHMAISDSPGASTTSSDYGDSLRRRLNTEAKASSGSSMEEEMNKASNSGDVGNIHATTEGEPKVVNGGGAQDFEAAIKYSYRPSSPAHRKVKESPLSSDAIFRQSHAGLFNLCVVVLVAVNSRLIIENLMKYGLLIRAGFWFSSKSLRDWPLFMCCLSLPLFPLAVFLVEKLAQRRRISDLVVTLLHTLIATITIVYPVFVILRCDSAVQSGVVLMLFACTMWLKLVSYAHTSYDMRAIAKASTKEDGLDLELPYDVNFKSLVYFMVAPTLCYQTIYPRTSYIRKGWVARQVLKLVIFTGVMGFIVEQYINPIVQNSQHPLKGNLLYAIERVLKLSVPNLYVWLCMFYCFFHLWLNILAELLKFGDREFYKDWWNARTFEEYWRMWNMPVHKWMVRHVYFPCLRNGIPKGVAVLIAFLISAIFHELCIAVPCHIFKLWAFLGIMFQVPLVLFTNFLQRKFQNSMVGNMIFWFIFSVFGQPMCVLLYYHDLMNRKGNSS